MKIFTELILSNSMFPIIVFISISLIWFSTFFLAHRFYFQFKAKYPLFVKNNISNSDNFSRDPDKFLFIFRKETIVLLQDNAKLSKDRNVLILFVKLSILTPILIFIILLIIFLGSNLFAGTIL